MVEGVDLDCEEGKGKAKKRERSKSMIEKKGVLYDCMAHNQKWKEQDELLCKKIQHYQKKFDAEEKIYDMLTVNCPDTFLLLTSSKSMVSIRNVAWPEPCSDPQWHLFQFCQHGVHSDAECRSALCCVICPQHIFGVVILMTVVVLDFGWQYHGYKDTAERVEVIKIAGHLASANRDSTGRNKTQVRWHGITCWFSK